jgi:hypothetical protein
MAIYPAYVVLRSHHSANMPHPVKHVDRTWGINVSHVISRTGNHTVNGARVHHHPPILPSSPFPLFPLPSPLLTLALPQAAQ